MGSRLGADQPKGCVQLPCGKTLFQILLEKNKENAPIAIMTSPQNHLTITTFLREKQWFGCSVENIHFFQQTVQPLQTMEKTPFIFQGQPVDVPDGNGNALHCFYKTPIYQKWKALKIRRINVIPIDNIYAHPFSPKLCSSKELRVLCVHKRPSEPLGLLGLDDEKRLQIVEYSALDRYESVAHLSLGNTGMFSLSLALLERIAKNPVPKYHLVKKYYQKQVALKSEAFIFDNFAQAKTFDVMVVERADFYPLKTKQDIDLLYSARGYCI